MRYMWFLQNESKDSPHNLEIRFQANGMLYNNFFIIVKTDVQPNMYLWQHFPGSFNILAGLIAYWQTCKVSFGIHNSPFAPRTRFVCAKKTAVHFPVPYWLSGGAGPGPRWPLRMQWGPMAWRALHHLTSSVMELLPTPFFKSVESSSASYISFWPLAIGS